MSSRDAMTLPANQRSRSRKSLAHLPSSTLDQENATMDAGSKTPLSRPTRKQRSKSIGAGGVDALSDTSGNRRESLNAVLQAPPRSILKPPMPQLREIPAHVSSRKDILKRVTAPAPENQQAELLIDFDVGPTVTKSEANPSPMGAAQDAPSNETRVTLRTEEEQQAAVKEREEKEKAVSEQEGDTRREARRKSLANRRVSFAPEATLHTWDVVVEYQDSTTSSNSTTRRASAGGTLGPRTPGPPSSDPSEPPSTPPEQVEEEPVKVSPAHQRDLHQRKRRRSSGVPPLNFNNPDDVGFSSSPGSDSSAGDVGEGLAENDSNSDSDNDGTVTVDVDVDGTDMTMASVKSTSSTGSSARLEESLRLAAQQAGTQGIDFDENGDVTPEQVGDVVGTFQPWSRPPVANLSALQDQENINPFSPAFKAVVAGADDGDMTMDVTHAGGQIFAPEGIDEEMSMDVTKAIGGIISNSEEGKPSRATSMLMDPRQISRRSSGARSSLGNETMELTTVVGGIQAAGGHSKGNDNEDMTMELTTVMGGVLTSANGPNSRRRSSIASSSKQHARKNRESLDSSGEDQTMDMTMAIGGIMPSINEITAGPDATVEMDMTKALGGILPSQLSTGNRSQAKKLMELETDAGSSPFQLDVPASSPLKVQNPMTVASETGSPSLAAFRGKGLRRSTGLKASRLSSSTPVKKPLTPSKQMTPQPARPTTPSKSSPLKDVSLRSASPKQLFKLGTHPVTNTPRRSAKKATTPNQLFLKNSAGNMTPNIVFSPQRRLSSGIGFDRVGLGSPRVAELLDRRKSLDDTAKTFIPSQPAGVARGLRFDDPRPIEQEIDRDREQDEDRENGRKIMEREADQCEVEKDGTLNLKDLISSLTPKKKSTKGRKSLHVGAAKGLLGKRPAELDEDEEEENDGIKRLKNHQSSPVKKVRLQGPPTKAETTGRITRANRKSLEDVTNTTPSTTLHAQEGKVTTPRGQGRFKDAESSPVKVTSIAESDLIPQMAEDSLEDDRIQLQDFLNMTSIRFMELTTTKRRHTIAPEDDRLSKSRHSDENMVSLEDCVATGAATIPMLELFQHACQELKSYISEGRKTVHEIESDTFQENPLLFREYISATPDIRLIMDNQLKNVKTHSRLLSKRSWYTWRMNLLETLKDGLLRSSEGMDSDEKSLAQQEELLNSILPQLLQQVENLEVEEADLKGAAEELANCDQGDLSNARQQLVRFEADIQTKQQLIADLHKQLEGKTIETEAGTKRKQDLLNEITEAERIREECRGWNSGEISALKARVEAIESEYGWTITGVSGTITSMTYKKQIELVLDASSFMSSSRDTSKASSPSKHRPSPPLDLWYIATHHPSTPTPSTTERQFFLQSIRDHIRGLPQSTTPIKTLLSSVSQSWEKVLQICDDIRLLRLVCPTEVETTSDTSLLIRSSLLIPQLASKVELRLGLVSGSGGDEGIDIRMLYETKVIYGERFNEAKMAEFLSNRCGEQVLIPIGEQQTAKKPIWGEAVLELRQRLLARGKK